MHLDVSSPEWLLVFKVLCIVAGMYLINGVIQRIRDNKNGQS